MDDLFFLHETFDGTHNREIGKETLQNLEQWISLERPHVVLVEDDLELGRAIKIYLEKSLGIAVVTVNRASDAIHLFSVLHSNYLKHKPPLCLLTDVSLENGTDGLLIIDLLKEKRIRFCSLVMTGFASIESAINATKKGVYHYLTKPFELSTLSALVKSAFIDVLEVDLAQHKHGPSKLHLNLSSLASRPKELTERDSMYGMVGRSKIMQEVFERIQKVAKTDSTILITGDSGTGKELIATALHKLSSRHNHRLVSVNCGAIPKDLLESELFGHVKGAFTGASHRRLGRFELAQNGTIFLDEIGDMPYNLQVKLLRVLQTRTIEPVGSESSVELNVRIIAATHKNLEDAVANGTFREDLFYRLSVIPIHVPALKQRREDMPPLIDYFLKRFTSADGSNQIEFDAESLDLISNYDWPGNVRELENLIERLVILRGGNRIRPEDLPVKIYRFHSTTKSNQNKNFLELPEQGLDLRKMLSEIEDGLIYQAMMRTNGNKNQASKLLGLNRTTLIEKMKKKELEF